MKPMLYLCALVIYLTVASALRSFSFPSFTSSKSTSTKLKNEILELAKRTNRGLTETPDDRKKVLNIFEQLEKLNPSKNSLSSPNVNAVWKLEYTTSDSILGRKGYKKVGEILQVIDAKNLKAKNSETIDFFGFKVPRQVTADLTPLTPSKVSAFML
jgi:hypothetical protein